MPKTPSPDSKSGRNRAEGWKYAKNSGHSHEDYVASRLRSDLTFANNLSISCFNMKLGQPVVSGGGASATHVKDVFDKRTNGKPDLYIEWPANRVVRISLKKSTGGQVFLTSVERFVAGFEKQFRVQVPTKVKAGLDLFIGGDSKRIHQLMKNKEYCGPIHRRTGASQEEHQNRLVGKTLEKFFPSEWVATLDWFKDNIGEIAEFAFARGYASEESDFASHVWYLSVEPNPKRNLVVPISKIKTGSARLKNEVNVGERNGGSTIHLPFGFLQMHAPKSENLMQFHHSFKKIESL